MVFIGVLFPEMLPETDVGRDYAGNQLQKIGQRGNDVQAVQ